MNLEETKKKIKELKERASSAQTTITIAETQKAGYVKTLFDEHSIKPDQINETIKALNSTLEIKQKSLKDALIKFETKLKEVETIING